MLPNFYSKVTLWEWLIIFVTSLVVNRVEHWHLTANLQLKIYVLGPHTVTCMRHDQTEQSLAFKFCFMLNLWLAPKATRPTNDCWLEDCLINLPSPKHSVPLVFNWLDKFSSSNHFFDLDQGWASFFGLLAKIDLINDKIFPRANQNLWEHTAWHS